MIEIVSRREITNRGQCGTAVHVPGKGVLPHLGRMCIISKMLFSIVLFD